MGGKYSSGRPEKRSNEGDGHIRDTFRWQETCWLGRHNTLQSKNGRVCPMVLLLGKVLYEHSALSFDEADKISRCTVHHFIYWAEIEDMDDRLECVCAKRVL
jgi:hypothetical protein